MDFIEPRPITIQKRPVTQKRTRFAFIDKELKKKYPIHLKKFITMHDPHARTTSYDFPVSTEGFWKFIEVMGDVPKGMTQPSLGRRDHTKPYTPDNIFWQAWKYNEAESWFRIRWLYPKGFTTWEEALHNAGERCKVVHPSYRR